MNTEYKAFFDEFFKHNRTIKHGWLHAAEDTDLFSLNGVYLFESDHGAMPEVFAEILSSICLTLPTNSRNIIGLHELSNKDNSNRLTKLKTLINFCPIDREVPVEMCEFDTCIMNTENESVVTQISPDEIYDVDYLIVEDCAQMSWGTVNNLLMSVAIGKIKAVIFINHGAVNRDDRNPLYQIMNTKRYANIAAPNYMINEVIRCLDAHGIGYASALYPTLVAKAVRSYTQDDQMDDYMPVNSGN